MKTPQEQVQAIHPTAYIQEDTNARRRHVVVAPNRALISRDLETSNADMWSAALAYLSTLGEVEGTSPSKPEKRTLIISGYGGGSTEGMDPITASLVNRFHDELKPWERVYFDDECEGCGDLWYAEYDSKTGMLSSSTGCNTEVTVCGPGLDPVKDLLPALQLLLDAHNG